MEENNKQIFTRLSPWPFAIAAILATLLTYYLFGLYSLVHWKLRSSILHVEVEKLILQNNINDSGVKLPTDTAKLLSELIKTEKSRGAAWGEALSLSGLGLYHLTGLVAFIFSLLTFARKPRWIAYVAFPFGLAGLLMAIAVM